MNHQLTIAMLLTFAATACKSNLSLIANTGKSDAPDGQQESETPTGEPEQTATEKPSTDSGDPDQNGQGNQDNQDSQDDGGATSGSDDDGSEEEIPPPPDTTPPEPATNAAWTGTSPHPSLTLTANWTKSIATDLAGQTVQFFSDMDCSTPSGAPVAVALDAVDPETIDLIGTDGGTFSFKVTSTDTAGNTSSSACSPPLNVIMPFGAFWTVTAAPLYDTDHSRNWNKHIELSDGSACVAGTTTCRHGGESRIVRLPGVTDCAGLSAADNLSAFEWRCLPDPDSGDVAMISYNLQDGKFLTDLIKADGSGFRQMQVTVNRYSDSASTPLADWWTNSFVQLSGGAGTVTLGTAGTIYTVNAPLTANKIDITAAEVGLVVMPGQKVTAGASPAACAGAATCLVSIPTFGVWVEGTFDGNNGGTRPASVIETSFASQLNLRNLDLAGAGSYALTQGGALNLTYQGRYMNINIHDAPAATYFYGCFSCLVHHLSASRLTGADGININNGMPGSWWHDISYSTAGGYGMYAWGGDGGVFTQITSAGNNQGIRFRGASYVNISGVTVGHNRYDGFLSRLGYHRNIRSVASVNNTNSGFSFSNDGPEFNYFDIAAIGNGTHGINMVGGPDMLYRGHLVVGSNNGGGVGEDCDLATATANVADVTCAPATADAGLITPFASGAVLTNTFGAVSGPTLYSAIANWHVDPFKLWIEQTGNGGDEDGRCESGEFCVMVDFTLKLGDTGRGGTPVLHNVRACPGAEDFFTQSHSTSTTNFLKHTREILYIDGNDNGLCESGETCLYMPNIGSYQGHGLLIPASQAAVNTNTCPDIGDTGTMKNIKLLKHSENGY